MLLKKWIKRMDDNIREIERLGWGTEENVMEYLLDIFPNTNEDEIKSMEYFCFNISEKYKKGFRRVLTELNIPHSDGEEDGLTYIKLTSPVHAATGMVMWEMLEKYEKILYKGDE